MILDRQRSAAWLDGFAISLSAACMVHCLALPLLIALLPMWLGWMEVPEGFHLVVLLIALPFSGLVLWRAAKRSRRARSTLRLGLAGLSLMAGGVLLEGHAAEPWVTSLGAVMLASAHLTNWRNRAHCIR